jgi:hypothetical protein
MILINGFPYRFPDPDDDGEAPWWAVVIVLVTAALFGLWLFWLLGGPNV